MNRIVMITLGLGLVAASLVAQPYGRHGGGRWNDEWDDGPMHGGSDGSMHGWGDGRGWRRDRDDRSSWRRDRVPAKVSDALTADDDAIVFLAGKFTEGLKFPTLDDGSGSIALDLPSYHQRRQGPGSRSSMKDLDGKNVRLMGEVDVNSDGSREIDVHWIELDE